MTKRFLTAAVGLFLAGVASAEITIQTVPVGNAGNAKDPATGDLYGQVNYEYSIGKYEVTAGQYTAFLNAVAATDTYALYNASMWSHQYGCKIERTGLSGTYAYSVATDYANRPVNFVSFGDTLRFANWLHNGQPTGEQGRSTTEDGAYYLDGATTIAALRAVNRNADWKWAIPSEDEWYKAAYYKGGSTAAGYWLYPTRSDSQPSNLLGSPSDPGNSATFWNSVYTIGSPYYRTDVGEHENSASPYGTFDQAGNVEEWNEAIYSSDYRGVRGQSAFHVNDNNMRSDFHSYYTMAANGESNFLGFRVVQAPEPGTISLAALGAMMLLGRWRSLR